MAKKKISLTSKIFIAVLVILVLAVILSRTLPRMGMPITEEEFPEEMIVEEEITPEEIPVEEIIKPPADEGPVIIETIGCPEVFMYVDQSITINNSTVKLLNVGSGTPKGTIIVDVNGVRGTVTRIDEVNNVEIILINTFYSSRKVERAATFEICV